MPTRPQDAAAAATTAQTLSGALRRERLQSLLTQAELAEKVGISLEAYSRLERGQSLPSFPTLLKVCEVLHTSPDALLLSGTQVQHDAPQRVKNPARIRRGFTRVVLSGVRPKSDEEPKSDPEGTQAAEAKALKNEKSRRRLWRSVTGSKGPQVAASQATAEESGLLSPHEQARLEVVVDLLTRLCEDDRAAIEAVVVQLARRAGILPTQD